MRRFRARGRRAGPLLLAAPLALLTGACAHRPWTPSVSVAYWSEDVDHTEHKALPSSADLAARWRLPASLVWSRYQKITLVSSLDSTPADEELPAIEDLDVVRRASAVGARVADLGVPSDAMWLVDMRGAASVAFAASLSNRSPAPVAPVATFNNWPAENELVPAEETLAALIDFTPKIPAENTPNATPVLMLDAWRLAYRFDEPDDDVHDNRYVLNPPDFPDVATLKSQGIARVFYLVEDLDDAEVEEDDVHSVFIEYQAAGIQLFMIDLSTIEKASSLAPGAPEIAARLLVVEPRAVLLDDPTFYARAHGGFGGLYAVGGGYWGGGFVHYGGGWHGGGGFYGGFGGGG
jgi:hypothetical protein